MPSALEKIIIAQWEKDSEDRITNDCLCIYLMQDHFVASKIAWSTFISSKYTVSCIICMGNLENSANDFTRLGYAVPYYSNALDRQVISESLLY